MSETFWYLSFVDDTRAEGDMFVGAVIVRAFDFPSAVYASHVLGINPGGEVMGVPARSDATVPPRFVGRLLSREDVDAMDREMLDEVP